MALSQIEKLKTELAKLEEEAFTELKAKREALVAEIASVDEQIAALGGTVVGGPKRRAEKKPAGSTSQQELKELVPSAPKNNHGIGQEDLEPRNDKALDDVNSKLPNSIPVEDQDNPRRVTQIVPSSLPGFLF